jgi:hypothetical protein
MHKPVGRQRPYTSGAHAGSHPAAADIRGIKIALEMMQYPYAVLQRCWSWDAQELRRARDVKRRNVL